jgi:MFS family permease
MSSNTRYDQKVNPFQAFKNQEWLLIITFIILMSSFGIGLTNPILSLYGSSFINSRFMVGIFMMIFALGRVLATIPATYLASKWGYVRIMIVGLLIKAAGALGVACAQSFINLIPPRLMDGMGDALLMSSSLLAVTKGSEPEMRGRSISLYQAGAFLGLMLSPTLGGVLANGYGMRMPIYVQSSLSLIIAFMLLSLSRRIRIRRQKKDDVSVENPDEILPLPIRIAMYTSFSMVALAAFLIFVARAGVRDTLLPIYANDQIGLRSVEIGILFNLFAFFNFISIPVSGFLTDQIGSKLLVGGGLLVLGFGILLTGFSNSYAWLLVGVVAMACGKGLSEPATLVYLSEIVPMKRISLSFGFFLTFRDLGLVAGPILLGGIADLYGLKTPIIVTGIICGICAFCFMLFAQKQRIVESA